MSSFNRLKTIKQQQIDAGIDPCQRPDVAHDPVNIGTLADYQAAMEIALEKIKLEKVLKDKQRVKQSLLAEFLPFVDDYMQKGHDYPNDVAVRVMIWLLDTGNIEKGLSLGLYLVKQNNIMPPKFDRDIPTFLCDFIYDWANEQLKNEQSASPYLDQLVTALDQGKWRLSQPVHSKMYAMLAKHKLFQGEYKHVIELCAKAQDVNPEGHGTKGLMEKAKAKLNGS